MGVKRLEDLVAFRLALEFKRGVYAIVRKSPQAWNDLRYRSQLFDAASGVEANIAEGWKRFSAGDMALFLRYALSSLEEAKRRLKDGIDRGYFTDSDCSEILVIGYCCGAATMGLWKVLQEFAAKKRRGRQ